MQATLKGVGSPAQRAALQAEFDEVLGDYLRKEIDDPLLVELQVALRRRLSQAAEERLPYFKGSSVLVVRDKHDANGVLIVISRPKVIASYRPRPEVPLPVPLPNAPRDKALDEVGAADSVGIELSR